MKKIKGITALVLSALFVLSLAACSKDSVKLNIDQPKSISTMEDGEEAPVSDAIEASDNVNGKRFALTLHEFTVRYNTAKKLVKDTDLIMEGNWREMGDPETDNKGVDFQYYYYDDHNVNITATEEIESGKLMNVGVGTTMSHFMAEESGENNSDEILRKAALMAEEHAHERGDQRRRDERTQGIEQGHPTRCIARVGDHRRDQDAHAVDGDPGEARLHQDQTGEHTPGRVPPGGPFLCRAVSHLYLSRSKPIQTIPAPTPTRLKTVSS